VYLLSGASIFVLHYVGDRVDSGYCVLLLSDLAYALCYAPILLRKWLVGWWWKKKKQKISLSFSFSFSFIIKQSFDCLL
jgi:hypothetical protein